MYIVILLAMPIVSILLSKIHFILRTNFIDLILLKDAVRRIFADTHHAAQLEIMPFFAHLCIVKPFSKLLFPPQPLFLEHQNPFAELVLLQSEKLMAEAVRKSAVDMMLLDHIVYLVNSHLIVLIFDTAAKTVYIIFVINYCNF